MWLLHIDDNPAVQRTVCRSFRAITGLEIVRACSCATALDAYRSRRPPEPLAIVSDFDLGKSEPDGAVIVAALRGAGLVSPFAFLTSTPEAHVRRRLADERIADAIPLWHKPDGTLAAVKWVDALARPRGAR